MNESVRKEKIATAPGETGLNERERDAAGLPANGCRPCSERAEPGRVLSLSAGNCAGCRRREFSASPAGRRGGAAAGRRCRRGEGACPGGAAGSRPRQERRPRGLGGVSGAASSCSAGAPRCSASAMAAAGGGGAGTPKALPSSGPKSLREMPHPLAASSSDEAGADLTPSPDLQLPRSIADKDLSLPNGTPVDTSSPASSSSLLNRLQLDDDLDGEMRDLFVTVDDPKKHVCTMETYITYRVTTKTTRAEFDLPEYSMRRRYQDFDWLRNKLEESQPTHLIPPLPEKFVVKGVVDRFSEEFVETRRKALDKFLKRIADHPVLSFNEHFHVFLTAKDLNAYKKQGMALLSKMGESVKYVTGSYKLRSRPLEFAAIGDYLDTFSMKLGTIDRIAQRIIKEEVEYLVELREYGPVYSTWSGLERELSEPLEGVSACIGNCCTALEELSEDMTEDFLPVLREYILYAESMKNVLKKRDQVQAEYEAKLEAVALKREDRPKVPTDVEKCQDRVECFNADLKADMERWQNNKRQDFRQLLMGMADKNIQYYEKCLTAWESIIPLLQEKPETK
ncbi:sorting nexin-30 [Sphaerodactylus townsendi]|uniref:sorting nexin-30 n=1 Tax=Sphaerodactylus townsendi TaxID=933632 RepID=UPI0020266C37|nr:sorting nexin-30 [Sphaerodactylus townsendi]